MDRHNLRQPEAEVGALFVDRWSPRSFSTEELTDEQLNSLFEAARWAPSCYNEQPAHFIYARTAEDRERFCEALMDGNKVWARNAPVLLFVLTRKVFGHNGKPNRWAAFDAGSAWMSLALQARMLGLHAHAMAGFHRDKAFDILGINPEEYEVMAAVAIGRRADPSQLDEQAAAKEIPNDRRPLAEVASETRLE